MPCTDGATDKEHDTMLELTGQCPWCGVTDEDFNDVLYPDVPEGEWPVQPC
jgi:hypothetical protein